MEFNQFVQKLKAALPPGIKLSNPRKGITTIISYTNGNLKYKRGETTFYVAILTFYEAFQKYKGRRVSSNDLKQFAPNVFARERGHSCNCSMFFLALQSIGIIDKINGSGNPGDPFWVRIP